MELNDALRFINQLLSHKKNQVLNKVETEIFVGCWSDHTYTQIALKSGYSEQYIKEKGAELFKKLQSVIGIKISKNNFKNSIEYKYEDKTLSDREIIVQPLTNNSVSAISKNQINSNQNTNPFIPLSGKIDDEKFFFPRTRELNRIFECLNNGSNIALIGEEEVGKSSLLWAICHQSANQLREDRQAVFLDLNEISDNEDEFYEALCHEIGIHDCRRNELNRNLKDKRILLAIDNVGKLAWKGFTRQVRDWLRSKADGMNVPFRLVLAASSPLEDLFQDSQSTSPLAGICQTENIVLWSEETIRGFITSRLQNTNVKIFDDSDILRLIELSSGHPSKLMKLCNETYERYSQRLR